MNKIITVPTLLTLIRIALTPFIVYNMVHNDWWWALFLCIIAAITDFFDGFIARRFNQQSRVGAFLDPLADKIFLLSCYSALLYVHSPTIPLWFIILVFVREMMLMTGAVYGACFKKYFEIQPTRLGKITTAVQMFFIAWIIVCSVCGWKPERSLWTLMILISVLLVLSFIQYACRGLSKVRLCLTKK